MNETEEKVLPKFKPRRFPGTVSYEDSDLSSQLFFGREEESKVILHSILSENLVVLYAKSGNGKSSILQAKVFPMLRNKRYYPIVIRFNKSGFSPDTIIIDELRSINKTENYELIETENFYQSCNKDLLNFLHNMEIWSNDDKLYTPVLVLDQFEEIFSLDHNSTYRKDFFESLAEILKGRAVSLTSIKIVIAIREDYFGHLKKLAANIPSIFVNTYRLESIRKSNAVQIISKPSDIEVEGVEFESEPFTFSPAALSELVYFLSKRKDGNDWIDTEEIEPIQLQIICSELEERVFTGKISPTNSKIELQVDDYGGEIGLQNILSQFYDKQIGKLGTDLGLNMNEIRAIREIIEVNLISGNKRVPLDYDAIVSKENISKLGFDQLIDNKLLKVETYQNNRLVEIGHDTLVDPIISSYRFRMLKEDKEKERKASIALSEAVYKKRKKLTVRILAGSLIVLVLGVLYFIRKQSIDATQSKYLTAVISSRKSNPTLAYELVRKAYGYSKGNERVNSIYSDFRERKNCFILKRLKIDGQVRFARFIENKKIYVIASHNTLYRFKDTGSLDTSFIFDGTIIGVGKVRDKSYFVIKKYYTDDLGSSYIAEVRDDSNFLIASFFLPFDSQQACISPSGENFVIGDYLYKKGISIPLFKLLGADRPDNSSATMSTFSEDGKHVITAYQSSRFFIENIDRDQAKDTLTYINDVEGATINALALKGNYSYIYSGGKSPSLMGSKIGKKEVDSTFFFMPNVSEVNSLAISSDEKFILAGYVDNTALLWSVTGELISTLLGHTNTISYVDFSDHDRMITGDINGSVMIWRSVLLSGEVKDIRLANFSPFEYRAIGLEGRDYSFGSLYDISDFEKSITAVLDYSSSIPRANIYQDDKYYTNILTESVIELKGLYQSILRNTAFGSLKVSNQKIIYQSFSELLEKENTFKGVVDSKSNLYDQEESMNLMLKSMLLDTIESYKVQNLGQSYTLLAENLFYYKEYQSALNSIKNYKSLYTAYHLKYPKNKVYISNLAEGYLRMSWYELFNKQFSNAILSAQSGLKLYPAKNGVITNLALGYLLDKDFRKADSLYLSYEDSTYSDGSNNFKDVFLQDFNDLEQAGVISKNNKDVYVKMMRIKVELEKKSSKLH